MPNKYSKVNIEISNICNLQCSFCPEVIRPKEIMSKDLFREVISQVSKVTKTVTFHLMGDPLVHPDLLELVEICREFGVRIYFVTNGTLLKESHFETLLHPAFRQINFSLHSFQDNYGDKDPENYLQTILRFTRRALAERPTLFMNYRLWDLEDPQGKKMPHRKMLERIAKEFGAPVPTEIDTRLKKNVVLTERLSLHFDTEFTWPKIDLPVLGDTGTCYGLQSHFGVLVDGTVVPCCLDKEGDIALGNLLEKPLSEILKSEKAKAIVKGFKASKLVEELCKRCQYIERFAPYQIRTLDSGSKNILSPALQPNAS